jgi:hypothetical protein
MFASKISVCRQLLNAGRRFKIDNFAPIVCNNLNFTRYKYSVANKGVKGGGTKKLPKIEAQNDNDINEFIEEDDGKRTLFEDK